jgi:hypothetical protein
VPDPLIPTVDPPPCLLSYAFSTLPSPLQKSAPAAGSPGIINVWVSAPAGHAVYCNKIVLAVPLGPAETDLCDHLPSVTPNTTWWAISSEDIVRGDALGLSADTSYAAFTAVCSSDAHWEINYDLAFSLATAAVNQKEGRFEYIVGEYSGTTRSPLPAHRDIYHLTKGPVAMYLQNVVTTLAPPDSTTLPVTTFTAGQKIRVEWESNAARFSVFAGASAQPLWSGPDTSTVLASGLTASSTITVVADPGGRSLLSTVSVVVSNPILHPASVTARTLAVSAATHLAATTATTFTAASLTVERASTLPAHSTTSSLTVNGTGRVKGLTSGSATVKKALTASQSSLGAASATSLQVRANSSWFGFRSIKPGAYSSSSDGLVLGTVEAPNSAGNKCSAVAYGTAPGSGTVYAQGGNGINWGDKYSYWLGQPRNSFVLPVKRGGGFSVGVWQIPDGGEAPTSFTWVPFAASAELTELTDEEMRAQGLVVDGPPEPVAWSRPPVGREVVDLVGALQGVFGDRLTPVLSKRLRNAVLALATGTDTATGEPVRARRPSDSRSTP